MNWWQRIIHGCRVAVGAPRLATVLVDEMPEAPLRKTVYLVGEERERWIAGFICPCGCGELLQMSLMDGRPRWRAEIHWDGTTSLSPSVWRQKGCRSHFFLRHGRIEWV